MICGALQTLNEEACEDVLEETEDTTITIESGDIPQTSVIPPSPEYPIQASGESHKKSVNKKVSYDENVTSHGYHDDGAVIEIVTNLVDFEQKKSQD